MEFTKMAADTHFPALAWGAISGELLVSPEGADCRTHITYRGKHCSLGKSFLNTLDAMLPDFKAASISASGVSAHTAEKAKAEVVEWGWNFPVGQDLSVAQMRGPGLQIPASRAHQKIDRPFVKPVPACDLSSKGHAPVARRATA